MFAPKVNSFSNGETTCLGLTNVCTMVLDLAASKIWEAKMDRLANVQILAILAASKIEMREGGGLTDEHPSLKADLTKPRSCQASDNLQY